MSDFFWFIYIVQLVIVFCIAKYRGHDLVISIFLALIIPFATILFVLFIKPDTDWSQYNRPISQHNNPIRSFQLLRSYDTLDDMFSYWKHNHKRGLEVKFEAPKDLTNWEWTIRRCTEMTKMLKTIYQNTPSTQYNITCVCKIFCNERYFDVNYDSNNYTLSIKTGLPINTDFFKNTIPNTLHIKAEMFLDELISQMHRELPKDHYERIIKICDKIKSN